MTKLKNRVAYNYLHHVVLACRLFGRHPRPTALKSRLLHGEEPSQLESERHTHLPETPLTKMTLTRPVPCISIRRRAPDSWIRRYTIRNLGLLLRLSAVVSERSSPVANAAHVLKALLRPRCWFYGVPSACMHRCHMPCLLRSRLDAPSVSANSYRFAHTNVN